MKGKWPKAAQKWKEALGKYQYVILVMAVGAALLLLPAGGRDSPQTEEPAREEGRTPLTGLVFRQVSEYLEGRRREFDFPYLLEGTEFQRKVWRALCDIPYGETRTYGEVAAAVGNPRAYRAVGMANHQNPILIAVPCHRVIGADGRLVGYGSGLDMKEALLRLEKRAAQEERRSGAAGIRGEQSSGKTRR